MNRTSRGSRLVRIAARSPALARIGPDVARNPTPSSRATICASVVLPRPGGPNSRTWSSASDRPRAASMKTFRLPLAADWPTNSSSVCGRRARSYCSPRAASGATSRSSVIASLPRRSRLHLQNRITDRHGDQTHDEDDDGLQFLVHFQALTDIGESRRHRLRRARETRPSPPGRRSPPQLLQRRADHRR
ncbi:hypothetical protein D3C80_1351410 [compost metagenome]